MGCVLCHSQHHALPQGANSLPLFSCCLPLAPLPSSPPPKSIGTAKIGTAKVGTQKTGTQKAAPAKEDNGRGFISFGSRRR
jgi:hypothetical protein